MTPKATCPSLSPKCDGELMVSERSVTDEVDAEGKKITVVHGPSAAVCTKCGKRWTKEHLSVEGIDINSVRNV